MCTPAFRSCRASYQNREAHSMLGGGTPSFYDHLDFSIEPVTKCRKKFLPTVVFRRLGQYGVSCKYRRWRSRSVALPCAVSHCSLAMCPALVSSLLCSYCALTGRARDVARASCARDQERCHGQQEPA